jgi:hypothetical protein
MGRRHKPGLAGTWIEVKAIKGNRYVYERTRVYNSDGSFSVKSKYIGKAKPVRLLKTVLHREHKRGELPLECAHCARQVRADINRLQQSLRS